MGGVKRERGPGKGSKWEGVRGRGVRERGVSGRGG